MAEGEVLLFAGGGIDQESSTININPESDGGSDFLRGSYRYALNCRIGASYGTNNGAVENIPSTLLISNYFVWSGSAFVSGSAASGTNGALSKYEDRSEGKVYWFVKNSNGHDSILMYVKTEQKIYELIRWDHFNFGNFISVTKINKYLIFTDGNPADGTGNPPRMIDVSTIYTLFNTLGANFSEYHISFSKWLPVAPPIIDNSGQANGNVFIAKGVYQFAYRYIYIGGFRSCWSPPSNFVSNEFLVSVNLGQQSPLVGTPKNFGVNAPGFIYDYNTPANTSFQHSDTKFYNFVDTIEYAYRDSAIANWKLFSRVSVNGTIPASDLTFANSGPISNVAENDIGQYFDSVPLLSRAVEAIDNRPMMANNLDDLAPMADFDVTNIAVYSMQPAHAGLAIDTWYDTPALSAQLKIQKFSFKESGVYKLGIQFKNYSGRAGLVQTLDKWTYTIPINTTENFPASQEEFHALGFKIAAGIIPPIWAVDYQIVRSNCLNIERFIIGQVNDFKFLQINPGTDNSLATTDAIQSAISAYYDNYNTGGSQYPIISRILSAIRKNQVKPTAGEATLIYMDIGNWCLDTVVNTGAPPNPSNSVYYNWEPGDRVRFWANTAANYTGSFVQYDQEIIEYTGTAVIVSKPADLKYMGTRAQITASGHPTTKLFNIEVYRPKKYSTQNDVIYYEMGEWYPVIQPGTANRDFSKKDWTWTDTASVAATTLNGFTYYDKFPVVNGDVWLVTKNFFYNAQTMFLLNLVQIGWLPSFANFADIRSYPVFPQMTQDKFNAGGLWEHNTGRPLVVYKYLPKQFEKSTQVRFGGKFLEDSLFIGINNFQDQNQYIYPSEYGKIRALVNTSNTEVKAVGNILLVIGEEETWSVYVNRTTLEDLSGRSQVSLSDKVLGSFNTLLGSYGTLNPESVSKKNSRVLFWSAKRGMWIRYSDDGLTPISDVKMQNWFKDLSMLLAPSYATGTPAISLSVFDPYYEEWITYLNHSSLPGTFRGYSSYKCAAFSERNADKRWKSIHDYTPELFAAIENETYIITGTNVYILFAGTGFNSFQGIKKDSMIQFVANPEMRRTKTWMAAGEEATDIWSMPSIDGDYRSNGASAQNSALLLTDFEKKEDIYWSAIKRDLNTINAASSDQAIVNGDTMRAKALTLMLKLDPAVTWYSYLNWLAVEYNISEKTIKK